MLLNLPERLRWEVLYAVQQRASRGCRIDPENTKAVIRIMEANPSLATLSADFRGWVGWPRLRQGGAEADHGSAFRVRGFARGGGR